MVQRDQRLESSEHSANYIEKLLGVNNYEVWKFRVESQLQKDDIWNFI